MSYIQIQKATIGQKEDAQYVYLAWNEWSSDKRRSVQRRFYIGRIGDDGKVMLNKKFAGDNDVRVTLDELRTHASYRHTFEVWLRGIAQPGGANSMARVEIVGDCWAVKHLAVETGLTGLLSEIFGASEGGALTALAAHQLVTGHALYRAESWLSQRETPGSWKGGMTSESSVHGFVAQIGEDVGRREMFIERWAQSHQNSRAVLHDITSVSSYSPSIGLAEWGHNRDEESLPQVNFSLAADPDGMPLFYRVIPGSIPDVRTLATSLEIALGYGIESPCLSLDRGFYSQANVQKLLGMQCGFIIGVPWSVKQAGVLFRKHAARLKSPRNSFLHNGIPLRHSSDTWVLDDKKLSLHIYFDPGRHAEKSLRFEKAILALAEKASQEKFSSVREATTWIRANDSTYAACFGVCKNPDGSIKVVTKSARIVAATSKAGYTLVLTHGRTTEEETAEAVMQDYRARDVAEKLFDAFKTEDGQYRLRTTNDNSVQGRFFLGFITLILRAELLKRMRDSKVIKSITTASVFDELSKNKALITSQNKRILLEVSKKQRTLLANLKLPELA